MTPQPTLRIGGQSTQPIPRKIVFTIEALERITCPPDKLSRQTVAYDIKQPGLCMIATANGVKTFFLAKRVNGRAARIKIGRFGEVTIDQARKAAAKLAGQIAEGHDPAAERKNLRRDATLGQVWDKWLVEYARPRLRTHTLVTDESRWKTCLATWSAKPIRSIRPADVEHLHATIGKARGQTTANRAVQLLRRLLNNARLENNPAAGRHVDFFHETPRERYLAGDELVKLLASVGAEPNTIIGDFARLALWTGQRRGNVASMAWSELDLDKRTWTIPSGKFKTGKPLVVPLVQPAIDVLKRRRDAADKAKEKHPDVEPSPFVFPGRFAGTPLAEPKAGWKRILDRAGLADVHLHDLRHTFASYAVQSGASLFAVGKTLGHADAATTQRYAHLATDPLRITATAAADAMQAAMKSARKASMRKATKATATK